MKIFKILTQLAWGIAIISFPIERFLLIAQIENSAGRFNPYTSITLHISEIAIILAIGLWIIANHAIFFTKIKARNMAIIGGILGLILLPSLWAAHPILGFHSAFQMVLAIGIIILIREKALPPQISAGLFIGTMSAQAIFGIIQTAFGGFAITESGLPKIIIAGETFLRAHGSFPHPNLLAGYLLVALALLPWISKKIRIWTAILLGLALLLTASKAAWIAGIFAFVIYKRKTIKLNVILKIATIMAIVIIAILSQNLESITERWNLIQISMKMLIQKPLGIGAHHFTILMQHFSEAKIQPWQFQPVHNIYALITNEFGIIMGVAAFIGVLELARNHAKDRKILIWLPIIIIGFFDHYPVSLSQGIILTAWVVGWTLYAPRTVSAKSR